mmetsp:Transcript_20054/g.40828  ORF Transcript_20054/g.40828 Transcript_20054/m.40828 type:complete len:375 (+) Transcript_20054:1833-2957(+)
MVLEQAMVPSTKMAQLWRDGILCDAKIVASDGVEFQAHRTVLVCHSDYFYALLADECRFRDSGAGCPIELPEMYSRYVELFLEYIYGGKCEVYGFSEVINMLIAASFLRCKDLISQLERRACENVDAGSCLKTWDVGERLGLYELVQRAKSVALANFVFLVDTSSQEFLNLPLERLVEIIQDDRLDVRSEERTYFATLAWANSKESPLGGEDIKMLFSCIRYHLLEEKFVSEVVLQEPLLTDIALSLCPLGHDERNGRRRKGAFLQFKDVNIGIEVVIDESFIDNSWAMGATTKMHTLGFVGGRSDEGTFPCSHVSSIQGKTLTVKGFGADFGDKQAAGRHVAVRPIKEEDETADRIDDMIWFVPYYVLRLAYM